MKTICINCPMGCMLEVTQNGEEIVVTGHSCLRGVNYGKEEITAPKRVVTSLIKGENYLYSVKTKPVLKTMLFDIINEISKIKLQNDNLNIGDVVVENILNSGSDLFITGKSKIN